MALLSEFHGLEENLGRLVEGKLTQLPYRRFAPGSQDGPGNKQKYMAPSIPSTACSTVSNAQGVTFQLFSWGHKGMMNPELTRALWACLVSSALPCPPRPLPRLGIPRIPVDC